VQWQNFGLRGVFAVTYRRPDSKEVEAAFGPAEQTAREADVCRELLAAEIAVLSASPLARRAIDLARLDRAIKNWPTGDWHTEKIVGEYHFALTRGVAGARFLRWVEAANR
jgi:hypothetical protein